MIGLSRIQRYIFAVNARALAMVMGVISVAILLVDTVEQISTVGTRVDINLLKAFSLAAMKLPNLVEQTLPFALLIAAMITFRQLSRRAELPVIRASGLSAWAFLMPSILLALSVGLITMWVVSPIGSEMNRRFEAERTKLLESGGAPVAISKSDIWLRDSDDLTRTVIHAKSIDISGTVLRDVRFIQEELIPNDQTDRDVYIFARQLEASQANLQNGFWQLTDVTEYTLGNAAVEFETLSLQTDMTQSSLIDRFSESTHVGFWDLPGYIRNAEAVGINASKFRMRYLSLTAMPVMFIAMAMIGALACLRLVRLGRTAPFIAFGAGSGVMLFFINQLGSSFGTIGAIPPLIAAWTPPVFAVFVCLALIAFNEDG